MPTLPAHSRVGRRFNRRAGKENEISIGIRDNEGSGAPRLFLQFLTKAHPCGLITQKNCLISSVVATVSEAESRCSRSRISPTNTGSPTTLKLSRAWSRVTCP